MNTDVTLYMPTSWGNPSAWFLSCDLGLQVSWVIMYVLGFILAGSAMVICTHRGSAIGQAILGGFMALGLAPSAFSGGVLSMLLVACAVTGGMLCTNYQVRLLCNMIARPFCAPYHQSNSIMCIC